MTALDDRPVTVPPCASQSGRRVPPCGRPARARVAVGWMCGDHILPGAAVLEVAPGPVSGALTGPGLIVEEDGTLRAPRPPRAASTAPVHQLPDPARPGSAVQLDGHGAAAQAAAMVWGKTGKPRRRLIDRFIEVGDQGMTSWEAWRWYCDTHGPIDLYTLRPRLTELKRDLWIVDSGRRRHPRGHGDLGAPAEEVLVLSNRGRIQAGAR